MTQLVRYTPGSIKPNTVICQELFAAYQPRTQSLLLDILNLIVRTLDLLYDPDFLDAYGRTVRVSVFGSADAGISKCCYEPRGPLL